MKKLIVFILLLGLFSNTYSQFFDEVIDESLIMGGLITLAWSSNFDEPLTMDGAVSPREVTCYTSLAMIITGGYIYSYRNPDNPYGRKTRVKKDWQQPLAIVTTFSGILMAASSLHYDDPVLNANKDNRYRFDGKFTKNEQVLWTGLTMIATGIIINELTFKHEFKCSNIKIHPNRIVFAHNF